MTDFELDQILLSAGDAPPLRPGFRRQVWLRIESSFARSPDASAWLGKILSPLKSPLGAVATVLLTIFTGLALGAGTGSKTEDRKEAYVHSVSPFASPHGR